MWHEETWYNIAYRLISEWKNNQFSASYQNLVNLGYLQKMWASVISSLRGLAIAVGITANGDVGGWVPDLHSCQQPTVLISYALISWQTVMPLLQKATKKIPSKTGNMHSYETMSPSLCPQPQILLFPKIPFLRLAHFGSSEWSPVNSSGFWKAQ